MTTRPSNYRDLSTIQQSYSGLEALRAALFDRRNHQSPVDPTLHAMRAWGATLEGVAFSCKKSSYFNGYKLGDTVLKLHGETFRTIPNSGEGQKCLLLSLFPLLEPNHRMPCSEDLRIWAAWILSQVLEREGGVEKDGDVPIKREMMEDLWHDAAGNPEKMAYLETAMESWNGTLEAYLNMILTGNSQLSTLAATLIASYYGMRLIVVMDDETPSPSVYEEPTGCYGTQYVIVRYTWRHDDEGKVHGHYEAFVRVNPIPHSQLKVRTPPSDRASDGGIVAVNLPISFASVGTTAANVRPTPFANHASTGAAVANKRPTLFVNPASTGTAAANERSALEQHLASVNAPSHKTQHDPAFDRRSVYANAYDKRHRLS